MLLLLLFLLPGVFSLILTSCDAKPVTSRLTEGSKQMSPSIKAETGQLSANLVPYFSDLAASLIVARITGVQLNPTNNADLETGVLNLTVARVIHSQVLSEGNSIETLLERIADPEIRLRNQFNLWNALPLDQGDLLLVFVKPDRPPRMYMALAAARLSSLADPELIAAQQCYEIELLRDNPPLKQHLLASALGGPSDLLRFYALDVVIRRHALNRQASASILESAVSSEKVPANAKRDVGFHLASADFFDETLGADSVNVGIVSVLAKQMVSSQDRQSREQWLSFLSSCVSREFSDDAKRDREMRLALVSAIRVPDSQEVISVLTRAVREASGPDEAKPAKRLLEAWQGAFGPR